jgi:hypothetical protein
MEQIGKVLLFFLMTSTYTHPMPVHRTQMLQKWVMSGEFDRIISGDYKKTEKKTA